MTNSLARQAFALRARFPEAKTKLTPTRFTWIAALQPSELSRIYTVRVTLADCRFPKVEVLDPALEGRPGESIPHLFSNGSLCLHLDHEWSGDMMMVDTTVPWTCEWLLNYEILEGYRCLVRRRGMAPSPRGLRSNDGRPGEYVRRNRRKLSKDGYSRW